MKKTFAIEGMHCGACVKRIGEALREVDGVDNATVTLDPPKAEVAADRVDFSALDAAVRGAGDYRLREPGAADATDRPAPPAAEPPESLYPLFLIVGYLAGVVLLVAAATGRWEPMTLMRHFMAGFFLVFSFFKLLDLPGFVSAYRGYDLIGRRVGAWAWAYPFVELGLGVAYLLYAFPIATNVVTLVLMLVGAAGVGRALLDRRAIRCACLGTALNLPMTKVTLVEDLTMAAMAAAMLGLLLLA